MASVTNVQMLSFRRAAGAQSQPTSKQTEILELDQSISPTKFNTIPHLAISNYQISLVIRKTILGNGRNSLAQLNNDAIEFAFTLPQSTEPNCNTYISLFPSRQQNRLNIRHKINKRIVRATKLTDTQCTIGKKTGVAVIVYTLHSS